MKLIATLIITIFLISSSNGQSRKMYKFLNDYIKFQQSQHSSSRPLYFHTEFKQTKSKNYTRKLFSEISDTVRTVKIRNKNLSKSWNSNKIFTEQLYNNHSEFPKGNLGFYDIATFSLSKPIFNNNLVYFLSKSGIPFGGMGTFAFTVKWNDETGEITLLKMNRLSWSSPCI